MIDNKKTAEHADKSSNITPLSLYTIEYITSNHAMIHHVEYEMVNGEYASDRSILYTTIDEFLIAMPKEELEELVFSSMVETHNLLTYLVESKN